MAVAHLAMMRFADEVSPRTTVDQARREFALKALTSFGRTFATQMSALKHYRSGCEQRVTVCHVSVSDGSQAILGNVNNQPQRAIDNASNAPAMLYGCAATRDGAHSGRRSDPSPLGAIG